jgi:hypothetical protein
MDMEAANADPDPYLLSAEYGYRNVKGANQGVILEIRRERGVELADEGSVSPTSPAGAKESAWSSRSGHDSRARASMT